MKHSSSSINDGNGGGRSGSGSECSVNQGHDLGAASSSAAAAGAAGLVDDGKDCPSILPGLSDAAAATSQKGGREQQQQQQRLRGDRGEQQLMVQKGARGQELAARLSSAGGVVEVMCPDMAAHGIGTSIHLFPLTQVQASSLRM
jgi:uroporphyrinogen-III synthase